MLKQFVLMFAIVIGFGLIITHADESAQKAATQAASLNLAVASRRLRLLAKNLQN